MPDLFGHPGLPGLAYQPDILTAAEEIALIDAIDASGLSPFRFHGWTGKRLTASFGWRYDFDDASFREIGPLPEWLLPLRASAAAFARLPAEALIQALVTRYDPGAGIGWHRDRSVFEHVIGVSLGSPAVLRLRRRTERGFERFAQLLAPRSVYHLAGEARQDWEHSIAPMEVPRWSITFRTLAGAKARHAGEADQEPG